MMSNKKSFKMRYLIILLTCCVCTSLYSQTFSKIFDFGTDALENRFSGFAVSNDKIILNSILLCNPDSNLYKYCSAVSILDLQGLIKNQVIIDTFGGLINNSLINFNEKIILSGVNSKQSISKGRNTEIYILDKNLNFINSLKFPGDPNKVVNNEGIRLIDSSIFLMGNYLTPIPAEAEIYKLDKDYNILWKKNYNAGSSSLGCDEIQTTWDGNLAFRLKIEHTAGPAPYPVGFKILKINQNGDTLKSFFHQDNTTEPNCLLVAKDGHYYFNSFRHPLDYYNLFFGRINKLSPSMDSIIWSTVLPNNPLTNGRIYKVEDIIEAKNGDIVICGKAWDNEVPGGDKNSVFNGFIMRLKPDSNILWLKIYKNPQNLLDKNEFGKYRVSVLKGLRELDNGNLVAAGEVYYNQTQRTKIDPYENEISHLWLMSVDSMGCVDGYPCEERISLFNTVAPKLVNSEVSWTESDDNLHPQGEIKRYKFAKDSVFFINDYYRELLSSDDETGNNFKGLNRYFKEVNNRIYEYKNESDVLLYDFNLNLFDTIKIPGGTTSFEYMKVIEVMDSTILLNGEKRRTFALACPGFGEVIPVWIEGIGSTLGFLSVYDCVFPVNTTLQCFYKNDSLIYMNPDVNACLESSIQQLQSQTFVVSPNPTNDQIEIQGTIQFDKINIISPSGMKISKNTHESVIDISNLPVGIYILELVSQGKSLGKHKFIKNQ